MLKFFHLPKARTFEYKPLYYDADKEEREERERRIKDELGIRESANPDQPYRPHIKGQFRKAAGIKSKTGADQRRTSNRRLLFFILLFLLLAYLLFYR
jgi:hypothetical protein